MKRHKKRLVIMIASILIVVIAVFVIVQKRSNREEYKKIPVTVGSMRVTVLGTGSVEPENRLDIKAPVPGRIEKILVVEGKFVKKGDTLLVISSTERAALIDAARGTGGTEEQKKWEEYYKPAPVLAPINGMIIARNFEPGQTFTTADAILTMSDRLTVKAQVDETDIAKIHLKQSADIVLDAYPNQVIPAHVDQIAYDAKTINNVTTYIVDVLPNKTPKFMLSGMTANVTFLIDNKENVILLPVEAIRNKDNAFYTLVQDPSSNDIIERKIETGTTDGKNVEVVSGLSKGDIVLIAKPKANKSKQNNPFSTARKKS
jgi:macrolide-specific efflux system membrane fusion protein